jgi:hypothetical protein
VERLADTVDDRLLKKEPCWKGAKWYGRSGDGLTFRDGIKDRSRFLNLFDDFQLLQVFNPAAMQKLVRLNAENDVIDAFAGHRRIPAIPYLERTPLGEDPARTVYLMSNRSAGLEALAKTAVGVGHCLGN